VDWGKKNWGLARRDERRDEHKDAGTTHLGGYLPTTKREEDGLPHGKVRERRGSRVQTLATLSPHLLTKGGNRGLDDGKDGQQVCF